MKKSIVITIILLLSQITFSQTKQDYREYIKSQAEASPNLNNYVINIVFGDEIGLADAKYYTGKSLSITEYRNIFYYGSEVYYNQNKTQMAFEVIRSCDLRGIRKVSTSKSQNKYGYYYNITLYVKNGFLCSEWGSTNKSPKSINSITITVRTDEKTAKNIKNAVIELAKLSGSKDVVDGDNLFGN